MCHGCCYAAGTPTTQRSLQQRVAERSQYIRVSLFEVGQFVWLLSSFSSFLASAFWLLTILNFSVFEIWSVCLGFSGWSVCLGFENLAFGYFLAFNF